MEPKIAKEVLTPLFENIAGVEFNTSHQKNQISDAIETTNHALELAQHVWDTDHPFWLQFIMKQRALLKTRFQDIKSKLIIMDGGKE